MTEAQRITGALRGRWYGRYGVARCPAHGDRHPSLTLSDGQSGRLLAHCKTGCTFMEVLGALRGLGLIEEGGGMRKSDAAELANYRQVRRIEAEKNARRALGVWKESSPVQGTLAETYLRGRGIICVLPDTLRFHPACWHPSSRRLPAMVAMIDGAEHFAVHRTYLLPDGRGKAQAEPVRAMLGAVRGGAVRLAKAEGGLVIAEGLETALSLASGLLCAPASVWAALSTSGMSGVRLPNGTPGHLTIATDGDAPGTAAGHSLAKRAAASGWSVSILSAPEGRDWNDVLMMKGGIV